MSEFIAWLQIYAPTWYWFSGLSIVAGWEEATVASWIIIIIWAVGFVLAFGYSGLWYMFPIWGVCCLMYESVILIFAGIIIHLFSFLLFGAIILSPIGWITGMMAIAAQCEIRMFGKVPVKASIFFSIGIPAVVILWLLPTITWIGIGLAVLDAAYIAGCIITTLYKRFNGSILQVVCTLAATILTPVGGWLWFCLFSNKVAKLWDWDKKTTQPKGFLVFSR